MSETPQRVANASTTTDESRTETDTRTGRTIVGWGVDPLLFDHI